MMNKSLTAKLLAETSEKNFIVGLRESGLSEGDIRKWIKVTLAPYIVDMDTIRITEPEFLAAHAIRLTIVKVNPWAYAVFEQALKVYRSSESHSRSTSIQISAQWNHDISEGNDTFWSLYHSHRLHLSDHSAEDICFHRMRNIGSQLEKVIQPMVRELLCHSRHVRGKDSSFEAVHKLKFGNVVSELASVSTLSDALHPQPWGVPIHQWRNIAQHHDFRLVSGNLLVEYGDQLPRKCLTLDEDDFVLLQSRLSLLQVAVESARSIFVLNAGDDFHHRVVTLHTRTEGALVILQCALSTECFQLSECDDQDTFVRIELIDVANGNKRDRLIHATQLLVTIWSFFPREQVWITLKSVDSDRIDEFWCRGEVCDKITSGIDPIESLLHDITFTRGGFQ